MSISDSLTINGPGANKVSVSGNDAIRIFDIGGSASVSISGLTLTDGLASIGGGILLEGDAALTLSHCTLSDNEALGGDGGGILIDAGATLNLDHVAVTNNSAYADASGNFGNGGGIENDGSLTVTNPPSRTTWPPAATTPSHHWPHHRRLCRRRHQQ